MIIGTHLDQVCPNSKEKERCIRSLESQIREIYMKESMDTYPTLSEKLYFIDVHSARQIDELRDDIYNFVFRFVPSEFCPTKMDVAGFRKCLHFT